MKIYVASSWRNVIQPTIVEILSADGHDVYDFRKPQANGGRGFQWSEIDPDWENWTAAQFKEALNHPLANKGYECDWEALEGADATVLVSPCGRSAHLELGVARGFKQKTAILLPVDGEWAFPSDVPRFEVELMYKMVDRLLIGGEDLIKWSQDIKEG